MVFGKAGAGEEGAMPDSGPEERDAMGEDDHPDIVDVFYRPFLRPLGNMVITFARAENALKELLAEIKDGDERTAGNLVNGKLEEVIDVVRDNGFQGFELEDLTDHLTEFWRAKEDRNRLIHDDWWVGLDSDERARVGTSGLPRKKGSVMHWGAPTREAIWKLARQFRDYRLVFSSYADIWRDRRAPGD